MLYTAWGRPDAEQPDTLIEGVGPPIPACGSTKLFWEIEAKSWEEACGKYHGLQGWEPYKPLEHND